MAKFVYFFCNHGSANYLKEEIKKKHTEFNLAFSRQTFMTFKRADGRDNQLDFKPQTLFARAYGIFLAKAKKEELLNIFQDSLRNYSHQELILHESNLDETVSPWSYREELKEYAKIKDGIHPRFGDLIVDLIRISDQEFFIGLRRFSLGQTPFPGGNAAFELPANAPSRAWLKTEEAIQMTQHGFDKNDTILEIGSAPGGSVFNLLSRGLHVIGVDTGQMDSQCLGHPHYQHLEMTMQKVSAPDLKRKIQWLFIDINQKPSYTLRELRNLLPKLQPHLKGIFLTLKLTDDDSIKKLDQNIEEIKKYGMQVTATQLYHNKNEMFFYVRTSA